MPATVNPKQLESLIVTSLSIHEPLLITGAPGIGKTDIVLQAAKKAEHKIMVSHPVVSDPTDAKGLPFCVTEAETGKQVATFLPYGDLRRALNSTEPLCWFLDDLGQASPAVQASYMQLLLSRRINGHKLPDTVSFIAATNRRQDRAGVSGILEPVKSRFGAIVELQTDIDSWSAWAIENGIKTELIAFMRFRPELLSDFKPSGDMDNSPCPRTWTKLNKYLLANIDDELLWPVAVGAVGEGAAGEFIAFLKIFRSLPNIDAVLMDPASFQSPNNPAVIYALCGALARKATKDNFSRIVEISEKLPREFSVLLVSDCLKYNDEITTCRAFIDWNVKNADILL